MMPDIVLNGLISLIAIGALLWGFERYRTQFVKADFLISISVATGLLAIAFAPAIFDYVGRLLDLQRRIIVISLLSNIVLLVGMLYTISNVRNNHSSIRELTRNISVDQAVPVQADGGAEAIGVVIPAYNEEKTVGNLIEGLPESLLGYSVEPIVVSDGSTDTTLDIARTEASAAVEHPPNQGQGGALKIGFAIAEQRDVAIVATMDADGQHLMEDLKRLVEPIAEDRADYVAGSRHKVSDYTQNSALRRAGIRTFPPVDIMTSWGLRRCIAFPVRTCHRRKNAVGYSPNPLLAKSLNTREITALEPGINKVSVGSVKTKYDCCHYCHVVTTGPNNFCHDIGPLQYRESSVPLIKT